MNTSCWPMKILKANVKKTKTIEITNFVDENDIAAEFFDKPYLVEPEKTAGRPYLLLSEALRQTKKVGIGTFVLRSKEHMVLVKPSEKGLMLEQLRFISELTDARQLKL